MILARKSAMQLGEAMLINGAPECPKCQDGKKFTTAKRPSLPQRSIKIPASPGKRLKSFMVADTAGFASRK
jgi:hypothetical protein